MDSIEARAFKSSSLFPEEALIPVSGQSLGVGEDCLFVSAAGAGEDFSVDDFFDLRGLSDEEEDEEKSSSSSLSLSSHDRIDEGTSFSVACLSDGFPATDGLAIPADDIKELELWSHLMDDTVHDDIFACPTRNPYVTPVQNRIRFEPTIKPPTVEVTRFPPPVQTRPRSKRPARPINTSAWSASCSLLQPESSLSSVSSSPEPAWVRVTGAGPAKSKKPGPKRKQPATEDGDSADRPAQPRKCTHCQTQKTPQWRSGPLGPKTLCNACGVRFKSGRLFPEYRPACSPTFCSEIHSNSHRKVVEMRKKKVSGPSRPGFGPSILSC